MQGMLLNFLSKHRNVQRFTTTTLLLMLQRSVYPPCCAHVEPTYVGDQYGVNFAGKQLKAYTMPMGASMKFGVEFIEGDVDDIQFRDDLEAKLGVWDR